MCMAVLQSTALHYGGESCWWMGGVQQPLRRMWTMMRNRHSRNESLPKLLHWSMLTTMNESIPDEMWHLHTCTIASCLCFGVKDIGDTVDDDYHDRTWCKDTCNVKPVNGIIARPSLLSMLMHSEVSPSSVRLFQLTAIAEHVALHPLVSLRLFQLTIAAEHTAVDPLIYPLRLDLVDCRC